MRYWRLMKGGERWERALPSEAEELKRLIVRTSAVKKRLDLMNWGLKHRAL